MMYSWPVDVPTAVCQRNVRVRTLSQVSTGSRDAHEHPEGRVENVFFLTPIAHFSLCAGGRSPEMTS